MGLGKLSLLVCATAIVIFLLLSRSEGASSNKNSKSESRSDCDHILPLMMMLGAPPTASLPSIWLLSMLSLGVVVVFGTGNFSTWRWASVSEEEIKENNQHDEENIIS